MPNIRSAAKQARAAVRRRARNQTTKTSIKTAEKKIRDLISGGKTEEASKYYAQFQSIFDKATKSGNIHRNKANRHKSRIAALLKKK